uniref:RGS domain-containing protein n=1 Tax=Arcella intermedia TaxID=1963864 RepID=A0A6B2L4W2_9EUKA
MNLSKRGIKDLVLDTKKPRFLSFCTNLQKIELQHNKIETIPTLIANDILLSSSLVHTLTDLNLSHNRLSTLPHPFFALVNLRTLRLDHNNLIFIPSKILQLVSLESLELDHNEIRLIPWAWDVLPHLRLFDISHNELRSLPNPIGSLKLEDFKIGHNAFVNEELNEDMELADLLHLIKTQQIPEEYQKEADNHLVQLVLEKLSLTTDQDLFDYLLKDTKAFQSFEQFLISEKMEYDFKFWIAVESFRKRYNSSDSTDEKLTKPVLKDAVSIFIDYFSHLTSIDEPQRKQLSTLFTNGKTFPYGINKNIYNSTQTKVFKRLCTSISKWKYTPSGIASVRDFPIIVDKDKAKKQMEVLHGQHKWHKCTEKHDKKDCIPKMEKFPVSCGVCNRTSSIADLEETITVCLGCRALICSDCMFYRPCPSYQV